MNREASLSYLPIAEHGAIGDLRSVALVGTDGTIDWYCTPRFDSPSVFGAIVDSEQGGYYRIAPLNDCTHKQLYVPDTNVLITRFLCTEGVGEVQDFMPVGGDRQRLIRRVLCVRGEMTFRLECEPRFNYGLDHYDVVLTGEGALFRSLELSLALGAPTPLVSTDTGVSATFALRAGESATFLLEAAGGDQLPRLLTEAEAAAAYEQTVQFWLDWISQSTYT